MIINLNRGYTNKRERERERKEEDMNLGRYVGRYKRFLPRTNERDVGRG